MPDGCAIPENWHSQEQAPGIIPENLASPVAPAAELTPENAGVALSPPTADHPQLADLGQHRIHADVPRVGLDRCQRRGVVPGASAGSAHPLSLAMILIRSPVIPV
jgi:hypothetical protein